MTQLVGIDAWVDTILGRLTGAVPDMVKTEVTNTLRDFFVRSTVWRADLFLFVTKGVALYDLKGLVAGGKPAFVHEVYYDERPLQPVADIPWDRNVTADPRQYWSPEPGLLRLSPIPQRTEDDKLRLSMSLQPSGCQVPEYIKDQFFEGILSGAVAKLYMHPRRPYSNPSLGERNRLSYERQIVRARSIRNTRFTSAAHSFRYPRGWSPRV